MDEPSGAIDVVYAEVDPDSRAALLERFADDPDVTLSTVARAEEVANHLDGDRTVDCVVTGTDLADGDWRDVVDAAREFDADLPVLVHPTEGTPSDAAAATARGAWGYLPAEYDGADLLEVVRSAGEEYRRARTRRSQSSRYEALMETIPFAVYFKDREARYVDASRPFREAIATQTDEFLGQTDRDIWSDQEGEAGGGSYRDDLEVIETGEPIVEKEEHYGGGEGDGWMQTSKFPWRVDGETRGLIGMTRNVTERKLQERELRRQSQRLEQFASFVSHDLRNPINIAKGYLDRAIETGDEAALQEVETALDRMDELVDDLLATVRRGDATEEWIEFAPFVERVWTATETEDVDLAIEVPEGTTVSAVQGQLRQLLDNLFRNVDEHAGPDVTVTVGTTDVGFYVEDDGRGIDPGLAEDVFEYGVTDGGTGIGLAIVREIASAHGWELSLGESEAGGARFEFTECPIRHESFDALDPGAAIPFEVVAGIGDPMPPVSYERGVDGRTWTVESGGYDVFRDVEEHGFCFGPVDGSARIVARIADLEFVHEYSKAGLMVRDWPDGGSSFAYLGVTPRHGTETIRRTHPGEEILTDHYTDVGGAPHWYRLDWIEDTATFLTSPNGSEWRVLDRRSIAGNDPVCLGLAVCSHDPEETVRAVYEEVRAVRLEPKATAD